MRKRSWSYFSSLYLHWYVSLNQLSSLWLHKEMSINESVKWVRKWDMDTLSRRIAIYICLSIYSSQMNFMGAVLLTTLPVGTPHSYRRDLGVPPASPVCWSRGHLIIPPLLPVLAPYPAWISRSVTGRSPLHTISVFLVTFLACTGSENQQSWFNSTFHRIPCLYSNGGKRRHTTLLIGLILSSWTRTSGGLLGSYSKFRICSQAYFLSSVFFFFP